MIDDAHIIIKIHVLQTAWTLLSPLLRLHLHDNSCSHFSKALGGHYLSQQQPLFNILTAHPYQSAQTQSQNQPQTHQLW